MKITVVTIEATPEEIATSPDVTELLARFGHDTVKLPNTARSSAVLGSLSLVPPVPDAIPGVPSAGQDEVRAQLLLNPAAGPFVEFLGEAASWPRVGVFGRKPRGAAREGVTYGSYVRLRKRGSAYGAFAYATPATGTVLLRLSFGGDGELREISESAERLAAGHREYRVRITIKDARSLDEAIRLARRAYEAT